MQLENPDLFCLSEADILSCLFKRCMIIEDAWQLSQRTLCKIKVLNCAHFDFVKLYIILGGVASQYDSLCSDLSWVLSVWSWSFCVCVDFLQLPIDMLGRLLDYSKFLSGPAIEWRSVPRLSPITSWDRLQPHPRLDWIRWMYMIPLKQTLMFFNIKQYYCKVHTNLPLLTVCELNLTFLLTHSHTYTHNQICITIMHRHSLSNTS